MITISAAPPRRIRVWDLGVRAFHWLLVAGIALCLVSSADEGPLSAWHIRIGWAVGVLIAFRLVWGFIGGEHARFCNFVCPSQIGDHVRDLIDVRVDPSVGHNPLGAVSILLLLAMTAATVITGAAGGEDWHGLTAYLLLALVAAHVAGVVLMTRLTKDNLVRAMVTGTKDASLHPGAQDAEPPARLAVPVAAIVIGTAAYGATRFDVQTFMPHAADEGVQAGTSCRRSDGRTTDGRRLTPSRPRFKCRIPPDPVSAVSPRPPLGVSPLQAARRRLQMKPTGRTLMSKTTSLIRSGLTALAIITAVTATTPVHVPADRDGHSSGDHSKDKKDHGR